MDKLFAKRMDELVPSGIRKVNEKALAMERAGETVIHFELGRPDFDTPEYIKNACIEDIKKGDVFYTSNFGTMELREAIAWKLKTQNNVEYKPTEIIVSVGLAEAVFDVMAAILDEGDEVLVPNPGWLNYLNVPKLLGAVPITYTLKEENDYQIDLDEIRAKVTPRTKALVLITPSNPTGGVLAEDVLKELAEIAVKNDIMIISDEVYERLLYDDAKHISIASLPGMKERTITLNGFSKAYSMTGWRLGYAIAPKPIMDRIKQYHDFNTVGAPSPLMEAAVVGLDMPDSYYKEFGDHYAHMKKLFTDGLKQIGIPFTDPQGAYFVLADIGPYLRKGESDVDFCLEMAEKVGVACVPGTSFFNENVNNIVRVHFAKKDETLLDALNRLEGLRDKIKPKHR